jgi:hypothetical protein
MAVTTTSIPNGPLEKITFISDGKTITLSAATIDAFITTYGESGAWQMLVACGMQLRTGHGLDKIVGTPTNDQMIIAINKFADIWHCAHELKDVTQSNNTYKIADSLIKYLTEIAGNEVLRSNKS